MERRTPGILALSFILIALTPAYADEPTPAASPAPAATATPVPAAPVAAAPAPAQSAEAAPMKKGFIAGMAGPALVTTPGGGNDFIYGGRIGYTLGQSKDGAGSLGVSVNTVTESETVSGITVDARITVIMAEYVARQAFGTGLYFGGRMGFSMNRANISANGNSLSTSDTVFAYAPVVGFEAPLAGSARLMLDASWVNTNGGTFKLAGTSIPYQRTAFVALQAGILIDF